MNSEKDMQQPMMVSSHDIYTSEPEKLAQGVRDIIQRPVGDFPLPFALVPWGQHIEIITRSESVEEAFFYIHQVIDKGLSRTALINCFKARLYETQGKITNNFPDHLPDMNKADVQWSFKGISTPMGVATYNNIRIKDMLPTQEQLKERMELLRKEMQATKRLMKKNEGRA